MLGDVRKVQDFNGTLYVGIPKRFADHFKLKKGDYVYVSLDTDSLRVTRDSNVPTS